MLDHLGNKNDSSQFIFCSVVPIYIYMHARTLKAGSIALYTTMT